VKRLVRLPLRKKRALPGKERYHLEDTDFYLVKVKCYGPGKRAGTFSRYKNTYKWHWFKFVGNGYRNHADLEDFLEDPACPTEILFNLDIINGLK
jgi:hypothetical protein